MLTPYCNLFFRFSPSFYSLFWEQWVITFIRGVWPWKLWKTGLKQLWKAFTVETNLKTPLFMQLLEIMIIKVTVFLASFFFFCYLRQLHFVYFCNFFFVPHKIARRNLKFFAFWFLEKNVNVLWKIDTKSPLEDLDSCSWLFFWILTFHELFLFCFLWGDVDAQISMHGKVGPINWHFPSQW